MRLEGRGRGRRAGDERGEERRGKRLQMRSITRDRASEAQNLSRASLCQNRLYPGPVLY